MASKDKLKIMLSFMRELNDGNIPSASDYDITQEEFYSIVEACQDKGYIKDVRIKRNDDTRKILMIIAEEAKLTVDGMEYLHQHSAQMKTYRGLKEIREWLPW